MKSKLTQNLQDLGFEALTPFAHSSDFVTVRCIECKEVFSARYEKLKSKSKVCICTTAARKSTRLQKNLEILSTMAIQKGGRVLSEVPLLMKEKWTFECSKGHIWSAVGGSVRAGTWCPRCSGNYPRSLDDLSIIVEKRGGTLLSSEHLGVDASYTCECSLGHEFTNTFKKIEGGQWCPTCSKGRKSEEVARETFKQLFGFPFKKVRPSWLRNSRGNLMEIDGYCEELKIGFEYQGAQHFKDIGIYSTDVQRRIEDDELKFALCMENGIRLFYLTYKDAYEEFPQLIKLQCEKFGLDVSEVDFESSLDLSKAFIRDDRLAELRTLLEGKGIRVLSTKWLTSDTKYSFECQVCGHRWKAAGNMFFNNRKVAGCQVCAWKSLADEHRGSLQDLQDYAALFGGDCLSTTYVKRLWVYLWSCANGHTFEGNFNNMKFRGQFCPQCEGRDMREIVSSSQAASVMLSKGLEMLEPFVNKRKWLKVRCMTCGLESKQKVLNVQEGKPACKPCADKSKSQEAVDIMLKAGLKPLEPYLNVTAKWLCECLTCHKQVEPTFVNVKRGQGGCIYCGRQNGAQKRLLS
jgi:hypothetical protein